jgi:hypothetical protein
MTKDIEISEKDRQFLILKTLNFSSSRSFSFITLAKRKGFTNPFFRLLNFPDKNIEMS